MPSRFYFTRLGTVDCRTKGVVSTWLTMIVKAMPHKCALKTLVSCLFHTVRLRAQSARKITERKLQIAVSGSQCLQRLSVAHGVAEKLA